MRRRHAVRRRPATSALNSALLFHIVTDELASAFVDEDTRWGPYGGLLRLSLPIVLVPFVFALLALGILMLIRVPRRGT